MSSSHTPDHGNSHHKQQHLPFEELKGPELRDFEVIEAKFKEVGLDDAASMSHVFNCDIGKDGVRVLQQSLARAVPFNPEKLLTGLNTEGNLEVEQTVVFRVNGQEGVPFVNLVSLTPEVVLDGDARVPLSFYSKGSKDVLDVSIKLDGFYSREDEKWRNIIEVSQVIGRQCSNPSVKDIDSPFIEARRIEFEDAKTFVLMEKSSFSKDQSIKSETWEWFPSHLMLRSNCDSAIRAVADALGITGIRIYKNLGLLGYLVKNIETRSTFPQIKELNTFKSKNQIDLEWTTSWTVGMDYANREKPEGISYQSGPSKLILGNLDSAMGTSVVDLRKRRGYSDTIAQRTFNVDIEERAYWDIGKQLPLVTFEWLPYNTLLSAEELSKIVAAACSAADAPDLMKQAANLIETVDLSEYDDWSIRNPFVEVVFTKVRHRNTADLEF